MKAHLTKAEIEKLELVKVAESKLKAPQRKARRDKNRMNERTLDILDYIHAYIEQYAYAPSIRDICATLGITSTSAASFQLQKLERLGYIERVASRSRALRITPEGKKRLGITTLMVVCPNCGHEFPRSSEAHAAHRPAIKVKIPIGA